MAASDKTPFVWSLSLLIFVFEITSNDAVDLSTNHSYPEGLSIEAITEKYKVIAGKSPELNIVTCGSIGVCENGGSCVNEDGKSQCQCKNGTRGDRCEVVNECPSRCGNKLDVKCSYNVLEETAECLCNNASKAFDSYKKMCRVPCKISEDCPEHVGCRKNLDNDFMFCKCPFGTGGDKCLEDVDECKAMGVDCGTNPNVTCLDDGMGNPICYCEAGWSYAFNDVIKDCVKCNCQGSNLGCKFLPGGEKFCFCNKRYYQEDGICKACKCGFGSSGCISENGTKVCNCIDRYAQNNTTCEACYCGEHSLECSFTDGEKVCSCQPGYLPSNGTCKETCGSIGVCENGGSCINEDGKSNCQCKKGTRGDRCEVVKECPSKCGNEPEVKCIYNVLKETAECLCNNASKGFDSHKKKCRLPCTTQEECPLFEYGGCIKDKDNKLRFCSCPFGRGGDRCLEKINECKEIGLDCGSNPNVSCLEAEKRNPVCYCHGSWSFAYNYEVKDCVKCNCQGSNLGCKFLPGGEKMCYCQKPYIQDDGICKECKCGEGSRGCKYENGTKVCECRDDYKELNGTCESCYCGPRGIDCSFENGEKVCSCLSGSLPSNGTCKKKCSTFSWDQCKNGGFCKDDVCQCLPGTKGDRCEIIDGCEELWLKIKKCGYTDGMECAYNQTSQTSYCRCDKEGYIPDKYNDKCRACNCGSHGKCSFVGGGKTCDCEEGYAEQPGTWNSESECKLCNCGHNSTGCEFRTSSTKDCFCEKGYSQRFDECAECNCGPSLGCSFNRYGEKVCDCFFTLKEKDGQCYPCFCGFDGECELDKYNKPICNCKDGYGVKDGTCTKCGCSLYGEAVNCTFSGGKKKCSCPEGYEEEFHNYCSDIDECKDKNICPMNSECNNKIGSYECNCKKGFKPISPNHDTKRYGCKDIDECEEFNECPYRDTTVCINTYGSYYCSCKNGHYNKFSSSSIEFRGCEKSLTGWKIGYSILIVAFIVVSLGLTIAICKRRRNN